MRVLSLVRIPMSHIHVLVLIWVSNVFSHGPVEFFINKLELLVLIYNINAWGLMVFMFCRMWWWSAVYILPQSKYYIMFLYLPLFNSKTYFKVGVSFKAVYQINLGRLTVIWICWLTLPLSKEKWCNQCKQNEWSDVPWQYLYLFRKVSATYLSMVDVQLCNLSTFIT